jgi:hypothetical protein
MVDKGYRLRQMPFQIPREDIEAIQTLKAMPMASVTAFIAALKEVPPTVDTDEIAKRIVDKVPPLTPKQLEAILDALYGLYFIRELSGVPRHTFLEDFISGLQTTPELKIDKNDISKLTARFDRLLNIEAFNALSKAKRLQRDGERLYCDAKIVSDIRPVFGAKPTSRPVGAVVTHTLKLGYHEGGEHKEFHVVLDCIDLDRFNDIVERAQAKDQVLRGLLRETRLPDLGV